MISELGHFRDLFAHFQRPWFVAGGWAIDLWLGRKTREHADTDIAILRADQMLLREILTGWDFQFVEDGECTDWSKKILLERPIHEIHALSPDRSVRLEFLINESTEKLWVYRRDSTITLPLERMGRKSTHGFPFLNPAIVLLYKSKQTTVKDNDDFNAAVGQMEADDRNWLKSALAQCQARHPWIESL